MGNILANIPIIGGLFDNSQQDAINAMLANQGVWNSVRPQTIQAGYYNPQMAQAQTVTVDPALQNAQMNLLANYAGLTNSGLSQQDLAAYQLANNMANQNAQQQTNAILQNAAARNIGGAGQELGLREMAAQGAAGQGLQGGLNQAAQSAQNRLLAQQAYGGELGNVYGQQFNTGATNAGILNNFNQYNTQNQNAANQFNIQNAQNIAQMNNQNQMQWAGGMTGANQGVANAYAAQNAANQSARNAGLQAGLGIYGLASGYNPFGGGSTNNNYYSYSGSNNYPSLYGK